MDEPRPDAVEAFLQGRPPSEESPGLRARVLARTGRVLRRRRWGRRLSLAAALAACFVAGALATWFLKPDATPPEQNGQAAAPAPEQKIAEQPKAKKPDEPAPSALAQEWLAFDAAAQRARLFREAGDRYLNEAQDIQAALRCYTQALDAGADLVIAPEDSWLLSALKDARNKEKTYASAGS